MIILFMHIFTLIYKWCRTSKDFYFTGKRKEIFCERLQMVIEVQRIRQRHNTLPSLARSDHCKCNLQPAIPANV